ncbi:[protein-PII] uridylyltransferase [Beggiatoa leptomitoformis]|uniref:Bifunctional uridylyltransferase/uridylyl-removing enzyme n=1 Tax=Beggiatoa leptomitoformis TaxID=288004 RepID=A0A2N9YDC8_9GAMM|nr:[protein-PII] uridylyltransferase [Beggiatoa leptomitoformis]ALG69091.1 [protein-PII] uridylyltransferase [Beggiatoa leptomitoformis]AUI68497.1 [protein-PII] uridylyltransferase [Beggiatoa leptomitoformis]
MFAATPTDLQLFDPQKFALLLAQANSPVKAFREALQQGNEILNARFQLSMNAIEAVTQRAWLIDQILFAAWQCYNWSVPDDMALVAVGGYGRGELHPYSDIDLMILLRHPMDNTTQEDATAFITFLWDIQLEVGHSVRTLDECEQEALADITVITNLMEARLLTGSQTLFNDMVGRIHPNRMWASKEFFAAKVNEQNLRHEKYHGTGYNLEPNIKEGPGGLRDIQTVAWVAKRHFGARTLHDLVHHGFLTEEEYKAMIGGQEFLWKIRQLLHIMAKRREDRILFDHQRSLSATLGYHDTNAHLGVEDFMKNYYRTIKELSSLNDMLLQLFHEVILYGDLPANIRPLNKRFQVRNDYIEVMHDKVFMNYPFALLEIFLLLQQNPEIQGIRASTIRLMRQYRWLIDDAFHRDLRARSLFFEIIRQPRGLTRSLRRMNRYGILGAYIPAFGKIVGQMQYDLFHVYTVDEHSIFVVRNLRRFGILEFRHEFPFCSKIMDSLPKPELLYLAGLFHDIAKGRGGDHSILGESETMIFCQAHGLSDYDARFVSWLVRHHLLMSITAQRQDTSDPEVINHFAQKIGDCVRLDYLYLLTVADIRGTNPKLWNNWKDALLVDLYRKTRHVLRNGLGNVPDKQFHIRNIRSQALQLLQGSNEGKVKAFWDDLGDDYFLRSSPEEVARETFAVLNHIAIATPLVMERHNTQGSTEFTVFAHERDSLFAEITYFLEQQGITIVDAYIIPTQSEFTMAGFSVLEESGAEIHDQERVEGILHALKEALSRDTSVPFYPINRRIPRQVKYFTVPTRITFTQDRSNDHTILEVITTDRPGLLSRVAQAFVNCDVRLKKANIATLGSRVEDVFFITDRTNHLLYSSDQLDALREELSMVLDVEKEVKMNASSKAITF